jgi:hypothetical protein
MSLSSDDDEIFDLGGPRGSCEEELIAVEPVPHTFPVSGALWTSSSRAEVSENIKIQAPEQSRTCPGTHRISRRCRLGCCETRYAKRLRADPKANDSEAIITERVSKRAFRSEEPHQPELVGSQSTSKRQRMAPSEEESSASAMEPGLCTICGDIPSKILCSKGHGCCSDCGAKYIIHTWSSREHAPPNPLIACFFYNCTETLKDRDIIKNVEDVRALDLFEAQQKEYQRLVAVQDLETKLQHAKTDESERLLLQELLRGTMVDPRMCPKCKWGPVDKRHAGDCDNLVQHQGQPLDEGGAYDNTCRSCGFFSAEWTAWVPWDGIVRFVDEGMYRSPFAGSLIPQRQSIFCVQSPHARQSLFGPRSLFANVNNHPQPGVPFTFGSAPASSGLFGSSPAPPVGCTFGAAPTSSGPFSFASVETSSSPRRTCIDEAEGHPRFYKRKACGDRPGQRVNPRRILTAAERGSGRPRGGVLIRNPREHIEQSANHGPAGNSLDVPFLPAITPSTFSFGSSSSGAQTSSSGGEL